MAKRLPTIKLIVLIFDGCISVVVMTIDDIQEFGQYSELPEHDNHISWGLTIMTYRP